MKKRKAAASSSPRHKRAKLTSSDRTVVAKDGGVVVVAEDGGVVVEEEDDGDVVEEKKVVNSRSHVTRVMNAAQMEMNIFRAGSDGDVDRIISWIKQVGVHNIDMFRARSMDRCSSMIDCVASLAHGKAISSEKVIEMIDLVVDSCRGQPLHWLFEGNRSVLTAADEVTDIGAFPFSFPMKPEVSLHLLTIPGFPAHDTATILEQSIRDAHDLSSDASIRAIEALLRHPTANLTSVTATGDTPAMVALRSEYTDVMSAVLSTSIYELDYVTPAGATVWSLWATKPVWADSTFMNLALDQAGRTSHERVSVIEQTLSPIFVAGIIAIIHTYIVVPSRINKCMRCAFIRPCTHIQTAAATTTTTTTTTPSMTIHA